MPADDTAIYRLAPALAGRLVGAALVGVALLVLVLTVISTVTGLAWQVTPAVGIVGAVAVVLLGWWLFRVAWVVRLTPRGYAVRLLRGAGVREADWSAVSEAAAANPRGIACLLVRLGDGRTTCVPVAAVAGDPDVFARDVRRRLRDAHTPDPDSAAEPESL